MNIRQYMDSVKKQADLPKTNHNRIDWLTVLQDAGYHKVVLSEHALLAWTTMHAECRVKYGDHYAWTGSVFWFEKPEHAADFALTWL